MAAFKNKNNGTWYVQFRYTDWKGERQQKLKRGFNTKREAQEWEREFLLAKQADVNMTFESFAALYEKDVKPKLKLNTWRTKESIIQKKILPYFGKRKLSEITAKDIIDWQNEIREMTDCHGKPLSKTYLKTVHNQLSAIFNHAVRYYNLRENPCKKAGSMGKAKNREMMFWSKEQYLKFAETMMDKPLSYYTFEMLYWCGIREGELLALTPADFDFEKRTVNHNRWRNKTVAFRVSPEEDAQIETMVRLSGLTKQDYIIRRLLERDVVVQGNPRVYKALRDQLAAVLDELCRIEAGQGVNDDLLDTIQMIAIIMNGMQEDFAYDR